MASLESLGLKSTRRFSPHWVSVEGLGTSLFILGVFRVLTDIMGQMEMALLSEALCPRPKVV